MFWMKSQVHSTDLVGGSTSSQLFPMSPLKRIVLAPEPGSAEPSLVIWQWCRGSQGDSSLVNGADSILLGDEMWSPYLEETSLALAPSPNPTPNP